MAESNADIDKAAEKCVKEIMKIQARKDQEKQKSFAIDYATFKKQNIERTMRKYGKTRKYV